MSSRKAFEMKIICIFMVSAFFSEGEGVDVILKIFNKYLNSFVGKPYQTQSNIPSRVFSYVFNHVSRGSLNEKDFLKADCFGLKYANS